MTRVLHLSHDGLLEPLGWGQVARYALALGDRHEIHIASWEKPEDLADAARVQEAERRLDAAGVRWHRLEYHRKPPIVSKLLDLRAGHALARRLVRAERIQVVHSRSYFPSVIAEKLKRTHGTRFLFDMRGLWADDRVETGQMRATGVTYRIAKHHERRFFERADAIVSLTHAGKETLARWGVRPPCTVIPTCVDTDLFRPTPRARPDGALTVGYAGSVGPHYRFDLVARLFVAVQSRSPDARLAVVNRGQHALVAQTLDAAGVPRASWTVRAAAPDEVPQALAEMDVGVSFFDPKPSKAFSAPTRIAEFLASGLPFLSNTKVGDLERIVREHRVGLLLDDLDDASLDAAASALPKLLDDPALEVRCRDAAERHFSLREGVQRYDELYRDLA